MKRILVQLAVATMATLGLLAGTTVAAQAAPASPGSVLPGPGNFCHYANWGGVFYCGTNVTWPKPDGYPEVFVIGQDSHVWTRWSDAARLYAWTGRVGGTCRPSGGLAIAYSPGSWLMVLGCIGTDGDTWTNTRYANGTWSGWKHSSALTAQAAADSLAS